MKTRNFIKAILLLMFTLGLFGFMFYALTGFVMVFIKYDYVFLVCFILVNVVDFLIFELFISLLVGILAATDPEANGMILNGLIAFTRWRNGA